MSVKIRLARIGKKHAPFFRVVAIDSKKKRDGEALEILGTYNPSTGELIRLDEKGIDAWVSKGAVVTDAVKKLQKTNKKSEVSA